MSKASQAIPSNPVTPFDEGRKIADFFAAINKNALSSDNALMKAVENALEAGGSKGLEMISDLSSVAEAGELPSTPEEALDFVLEKYDGMLPDLSATPFQTQEVNSMIASIKDGKINLTAAKALPIKDPRGLAFLAAVETVEGENLNNDKAQIIDSLCTLFFVEPAGSQENLEEISIIMSSLGGIFSGGSNDLHKKIESSVLNVIAEIISAAPKISLEDLAARESGVSTSVTTSLTTSNNP